jgi:hypothetical protein
MKTKYNTNIPNKLTSDYLDGLINKVYALLPQYEESIQVNKSNNVFNTYQKSLIQTINGNMNLINYDNSIILDILSHLECLNTASCHDDYKRHVLKICNLLTKLKLEVLKDGL